MKSFSVFLISSLIIVLLSFDNILASGCEYTVKKVHWYDNTCKVDEEKWFDFDWSIGGSYVCGIHPSSQEGHTSYYYETGSYIGPLRCDHKDDVVWKYMEKNSWPSGAADGDICKVRWDEFFNPCCKFGGNCIFGGTSDYRWDSNDWGCVHCVGKKQVEIHKCTDGKKESGNNECESACGADSRCDEFQSDQTGNCPFGMQCDSDCQCSNSQTTTPTTTSATTTYKPQPRRGGGAGRVMRMETTDVLNNPVVILVALIAIVAIIYGVFGFFIKRNSRRKHKH